MVTYAQSFNDKIDAEAFLDTLLLKEEFEIAKVAYVPHDIYFIKPIKTNNNTFIRNSKI